MRGCWRRTRKGLAAVSGADAIFGVRLVALALSPAGATSRAPAGQVHRARLREDEVMSEDDDARFQQAGHAMRRLVSQCTSHVRTAAAKLSERMTQAPPTTDYALDLAAARSNIHTIAYSHRLKQVESTCNALLSQLEGLRALVHLETLHSLSAITIARAIAELSASSCWLLKAGLSGDERAARAYAALFRSIDANRASSDSIGQYRIRLIEQLKRSNVRVEMALDKEAETHGRGRPGVRRPQSREDSVQLLAEDRGRDPDDAEDSRAAIRKSGFGWEYELAAVISNDPAFPRAVPHIVIGFNQHQAGTESNPRAREIFEDIIGRGHSIDYAVADQAYFPGAHAEVLPSILRAAVVNYQRALSDDRKNPKLSAAERKSRALDHKARLDAQIKERERWEMRPKESPNERGNYPMRCPASGQSRTLECPLKPGQKPLKSGAVAMPVLSPPKAPGPCCTNTTSVKFHISDGGKYEQHHRYKSSEWQRIHSYGRQVIESFNYSLKHADNGLADSTTRRKRGEAGQAFLVLLGVIATNAARILDWESQFFDGMTPAPDALTRHARSARPVSARPRASRKAMSASRKAQLGLAAG